MKRNALLGIVMVSVWSCAAWAEDPVYFADAKLKALVEAKLGFDDPTPSDMRAFLSLTAVGEGITSLVGLEYATNMTLLNVQDNQISSVSPLSGLAGLGQIILSNNNVTDLSPLSGLTGLRSLTVRYNGITSVPVLTGLPSLHTLQLGHNEISSVGSLGALTSLTHLELSFNNLESLSFLSTVPDDITRLRLSVNQYSDVSPITRFSNLELCEVHWNPLNEDAYCSDLHTILSNNPGVALYYDANPGPATGVSASQGTYLDKIVVTWDALCGGPSKTVYYRVYRSLSHDGSKQRLTDPQTATSFEDTNVQTGQVYYYYIQSARWSSPQVISQYPYSAAASGYAGVSQSHVMISSTTGGSVTTPGEGAFAYAPGTTVSIAATTETDHEFSGWTGTAVSAGKVANASIASTTVTVDADYTLVANFSTPGPTYSLTISSGTGGSVTTPGEGTFAYAPGRSVMLRAKAETGYVFSSWSGTAVDAGKVDDTRSFGTRVTVGGNYTLVANFSPRANYVRALAISSSVGGTVTSPGEGAFGYAAPTMVSIVATAEPDYEFSGWTGTAVSAGKVADASAASTTVMADGDYTLRANFAAVVSDARVLSISSGEGGSVAAPGEGSVVVEVGAGVRVVALPDPGYVFVRWAGTFVEMGGLADPTIGDINFVMETDAALHATFAPALLCLYVDDNGPEDPYPYNHLVSDPAEDGTWEHPFDSVQEAIDVAETGDAVLVLPGTYREHINFRGKDLMVSALDLCSSGVIPKTTLAGTDANSVVVFEAGESAGSILAGFTIQGGNAELGGAIRCCGADPVIANCLIVGNRADLGGGFYCQSSRATLANCTIADNFSWLEGGGLHCDDEVTVINSIFYGNRPEQIVADPCQVPCVTYSAVRGGWPGEGNLDCDPRFVEQGHWALSDDTEVSVNPNDPEAMWISGDYHLKAEEGRWNGWMWSRDGTTSLCVDAGHPKANVKCEPLPNGNRINMGAFGGTVEASRSNSDASQP